MTDDTRVNCQYLVAVEIPG